jgi:hypothetical protein
MSINHTATISINYTTIILFFEASRTPLGPTQHFIEQAQEPFPWLKRPGREADHSSICSAVVITVWSYNFTLSSRGKVKVEFRSGALQH